MNAQVIRSRTQTLNIYPNSSKKTPKASVERPTTIAKTLKTEANRPKNNGSKRPNKEECSP